MLGYDEASVRREMLQARILAEIFTGAAGRRFRAHLALKGGLAMRLAQGSQRTTKDIDLQADGSFPVDACRKWMTSAIRAAARAAGIPEVAVTEPKQTETTQRWKIAYAFPGGVEGHLTVEMSRRGLPGDGFIRESPAGGPERDPSMVRSYSSEALASSKVLALPRGACRDVWDLHILVSSEVRASPDLLRRVGRETLERIAREVWPVLDSMTYRQARDELIPFLPLAAAEALTEEAWDAMRIRVGTEVSAWLDEALTAVQPVA